MQKYDDILDFIEAVDSGEDMGDEMDTWEEVKPPTRAGMQARLDAMTDEVKLRRVVGEAIFERLLILKMRQAELARRLGKSGSYVSRLVKGRENLGLDSLAQVARALECQPCDLVPAVPTQVLAQARRPREQRTQNASEPGVLRFHRPERPSQATVPARRLRTVAALLPLRDEATEERPRVPQPLLDLEAA